MRTPPHVVGTSGDVRVIVLSYVTATAAPVFNLDKYQHYIVRAQSGKTIRETLAS